MTEVNPNALAAASRAESPDRPRVHSASLSLVGRWLQDLSARLLPARCALCADRRTDNTGLCGPCRADLTLNRPCCARCAEPLTRTEPACGRCLKREPPFDGAFAGFRYAWPLDGLIARFKFSGDLAAGRTLAQLFVDRIRTDASPLPALLVPVPLHHQRLRQRGYDQALELGRHVARGLGIALATNLLYRSRATPAQTELSAAQRRRNVRDAFAVDRRQLSRWPTHPDVALIDDVMTTGATLRECAATLRRAGFTRIRVWCIARAPAR